MSSTELFYNHQIQRFRHTFDRNLEQQALQEHNAESQKAEVVIQWKDEQKSAYWTHWWRTKINSIFITVLWHFGCVFACTSVSLIVYSPETEKFFQTLIAVLLLVVVATTCILGRKIHTGKYLTKTIVLIYGLLNAYIYNSLIRVFWTPKYKIMILIPAVVALSSITIYLLILQLIGIRLTLVRYNGMKIISMELTILSSILLQIPYLFMNKKVTPYHEYLIHILSGEFIGGLICTFIACQLRGRLHEHIIRKNVKDTVKIYALQPPPEFIQMEII